MSPTAIRVLAHAEAFCGLPARDARRQAHRILYAEGLPGLLRGAPMDLLREVERYHQATIEVDLMESLGRPSASPARS